ncbi:MAG TPA: FAD-binding protein [Streptosporangiaceae bacterium]|nr:FAD-binding protein [Streptosporangiaceae bacterium]
MSGYTNGRSGVTGTLPNLTGQLLKPDHHDYDQARQAWNLAVDQRPAAVALPESPADIAAVVRYAAEHGLRVAAQGTGHNAWPLGSLADTVLVRTERMNGVRIDPVAQVARVEAGALWLDVVEAAAEHGLATLAGSSPDVGVVGFALGGGLSFLGRKYGLTANSVQALEVVTADGQIVRADQDNEPDLFWALRGGGGSFGIVSALELRLFPLSEAYAGVLWYPIERGSEVLHRWSELTRGGTPDELTTVGRFLNLPPLPEIPEPVRGKSFVIVEAYHTGDPDQADEWLGPLRELGPVNDTVATVPVPALSHMHMDPEYPVPAAGDGMLLDQLPGEAIEALVRTAGADATFPLLSTELRGLGGELSRERPGNGALARLDADYLLFAVGMTPAPELVGPVQTQVRAIKDALKPWAAGQMYLNFAEDRSSAAPFWTDQASDRLQRIKASVDPHDVIRANHPVPAAAA